MRSKRLIATLVLGLNLAFESRALAQCSPDLELEVGVLPNFLRYDGDMLGKGLRPSLVADFEDAFRHAPRFRVITMDPAMVAAVDDFASRHGEGTPSADEVRRLATEERLRFVAFAAVDRSETGCQVAVVLGAVRQEAVHTQIGFTERLRCDASAVREVLKAAPARLDKEICSPESIATRPGTGPQASARLTGPESGTFASVDVRSGEPTGSNLLGPPPGWASASESSALTRPAERGWFDGVTDFCKSGLGQGFLCATVVSSVLAGATYGIYAAVDSPSGHDQPSADERPVDVTWRNGPSVRW